MSVFDKIGDIFGGVFGKIADVLPFLDSILKLRTSTADVENLRALFSNIQQLGQKIEAIGVVGEAALEESSPGGDDVTISEGKQILEQCQQIVAEIDAIVNSIGDIKRGM